MLKIKKLHSLKVEVEDAGNVHHFTPKFVQEGLIAGWLSLDKGKLTISAENGTWIYDLIHYPGAYCMTCDKRLGEGPALTAAEANERKAHCHECSGDDSTPGYKVMNYYDAKLMKKK